MSSPSSASDDSFSGASPQPSIACETAADVKRDAVCRKRQRAAVSHRRQAETPAVSEEDADPNETEHERVKRRRKEQRMQRNRLSAARSRKRKEDMLETLSKENASLRDELALLKSQLAAATSQGFAAVNHSNFIVLMKLAAMYLIHTAIFVAVTLLGWPSYLQALASLSQPSNRPLMTVLSSRPIQTVQLTCPQPMRSFAAAVMPFALPPSPVR